MYLRHSKLKKLDKYISGLQEMQQKDSSQITDKIAISIIFNHNCMRLVKVISQKPRTIMKREQTLLDGILSTQIR